MDEWVEILSNVGFPIFVALYFMFRVEKKIDRLIEVVERGLARLN
ncbi:unnamed protein product [marine sediment metagenome]|uniref:YvrJ family protein n=1 Tax=marine sediment metagenome TaxID=412755 RepID=X1G9A9_9ZZZZ